MPAVNARVTSDRWDISNLHRERFFAREVIVLISDLMCINGCMYVIVRFSTLSEVDHSVPISKGRGRGVWSVIEEDCVAGVGGGFGTTERVSTVGDALALSASDSLVRPPSRPPAAWSPLLLAPLHPCPRSRSFCRPPYLLLSPSLFRVFDCREQLVSASSASASSRLIFTSSDLLVSPLQFVQRTLGHARNTNAS